ncbi:TraB/GumN family protein [Aquibacillus saliphilus]|uniref:TraB/GumN family protein n=1 Tax=Aquibacillus saliphilus TaxID=1909422 RepID=UPI001CEFFE98|nr:TraB/GumN family protein [Aquibacillus saliphilus]
MKINRVGFLLVIASMFIGLLGCQNNSTNDKQADDESVEVQETVKEKDKIEKAADKEAPFFWRVEEDGKTVYMLGSIHVGNEDMYPLNDKVEAAYEKSDALVVEANVLEIDTLSEDIITKAIYSDGSKLPDHLSDDTFQQLTTFIDTYSDMEIDIESLSHFEPWFIEMLLSDLYFSHFESLTSDYGVDHYFLSKAKSEQKEIIELEGLYKQLDFSDTKPEELQIYALEEMLTALEEGNGDEIRSLVDAWKSGDEEQLENVLYVPTDSNEIANKAEVYEEQLLENRNIEMIDKIENYLKDGEYSTYFVIVGAAHFLDEYGLDILLEDKGYDVQPFSEMD